MGTKNYSSKKWMLTFFSVFAFFQISAQYYWEEEDGGVFNIPAVEYNPKYTGYGSDGDLIYNKIDLQTGKTMQIVRNATLYDHKGNEIATAWESSIGWDHAIDFRDGGIIAGAITDIAVGGTTYTMVYAWSVNSNTGGRISGWMKLSDLSPSNDIEDILTDNNDARMDIMVDGGINTTTYNEHTVVETYLPSEYQEYYLDPDRDASYTAGKARYYYTNEGYVSGLTNIPETGRQRYGVAHDNIPLNDKFYVDNNVSRYNVSIYPPSSSTAVGHKLRLVWGYTITSAGNKIYSWVNEWALEPTGVTVGGSTIVQLENRNASSFALDGMNGGDNGQNVYLWSENANNANQQWIEIDRGNGYYSYQKMNTNYCIDGGNGGENRQNVYLWSCSDNNQNQHWKKIATSNGTFRLEKRNSPGYSLDAGGSGSNGQNVYMWSSSNTNQNQQWYINSVGSAKSVAEAVTTKNDVILFPNPVVSVATVQGAANSVMTVYDLTGKLMFSKNISLENEEVDLSSLSNGFYYAEILSTESKSVIKLIKQ